MTKIGTDKIIDQQTSDEIKLSHPATIVAISETEKILDFHFPSDFKELYLKIDGFVEWDWTPNMFSIWPLARIVEEYNRESDKTFIIFADYLINAHHLGFVKGQNGVFKNSGTTPELIADTFSDVMTLINSDADILY